MMKEPDLETERPRFTSVSLYNHLKNHLSFWYPPEWHLQEVTSPHLTVTLLPDPQDLFTHLTIEVQDIQSPLSEEERDIIAAGVKEGLAEFEDVVIDSWRELGKEDVGEWGLEWICRFRDSADSPDNKDKTQRRKRRARLFFSRHYLYSVICQGASEAHYGYWQGMFEFIMLTVGAKQFSVPNWLRIQK